MHLTAAQTDRAIGVLVGAALGDALGAGYEFGSAPFTGIPEMIGGGLGGFAPGEWTDDTAQTFAVARVAATGADLRTPAALDAIAAGFLEWFAAGPPDVGVHTATLFRQLVGGGSAHVHEGGAAVMLARSEALHARSGHTAGNGTLMRTSPVAIAHLDDPVALVQAAIAVATLTHFDPLGGEACALWCLGIRHAVLTGELPDLVALTAHLPAGRRDFWTGVITEAQTRPAGSFTGNGFVVTALQAAWAAIVQTPVPPQRPAAGEFSCSHLGDALATAIGIGNDTDTVASIAGAMLGARWACSAIPWAWRRVLHGWPGATGEDLATLAVLTIGGGRPDSAGWPTGHRIDYSAWSGHDTLAVHPHDEGVLLAGADALDDVPAGVDAVVSLTRVGAEQVPAGVQHATFRLIDSTAADNPNLAFVIDDAARAVRALRTEGRRVLLHCAAAQSRTPTVAARYATLIGVPPEQALSEVVAVLPAADPNPVLRAGLHDLTG